MSNYTTTRWVWPTTGSDYDRDSMRSRAHNLQRRLEVMITFRHPPLDIWRVAVHCVGLAVAGGDRTIANNARKIADRFAPRKRYSLAERRAIHDKAVAVLARLTPTSSSRAQNRESRHRSSSSWMSPAEQRCVRAWLARE